MGKPIHSMRSTQAMLWVCEDVCIVMMMSVVHTFTERQAILLIYLANLGLPTSCTLSADYKSL